MTPEARLQAAVELLEAVNASTAPMDRTVEAFLRARHYMGSSDRREVRECAFGLLRRRARLDWWLGPGAVAADWLLDEHPTFAAVPMGDLWQGMGGSPCPAEGRFLWLSPSRHGTDGFFVAAMERRA